MIVDRLSYRRGIWLMVLVILPLSLFAWSIIIWRDPEESSSLAQSIANNALPLYAFSIVPGVLLSALHTKVLLALQRGSDFNLHLTSASIGTLMGAILAGVLSIALFRTLNPVL